VLKTRQRSPTKLTERSQSRVPSGDRDGTPAAKGQSNACSETTMKRTRGTTNLSALFTTTGVMGLDLVAIRLGLARSLRLIRAAWAMVPPPSTLGLALGAISLLALALTMWWHKLLSRAAARRVQTSVVGRRMASDEPIAWPAPIPAARTRFEVAHHHAA
jgi:hypothetical protein